MTYTTTRHSAIHYLTRRAYRAHQWAKVQPVSKTLAQIRQASI